MSAADLSRFDSPSIVLPHDLRRKSANNGVIGLAETREPSGADWPARWIEASGLSDVEPGQLWFVELPPGAEPSPLERRALTTANVVLYDRTLADTVAALLPLGAYAEPAVPASTLLDNPSDRSLHFVLDGWSVTRLIDAAGTPLRQRVDQIQGLSRRLLGARSPNQLPVILFAGEDGGCLRQTEAHLGTLGATIAECHPASRLTLFFGAVRTRSAGILSFASSNGLAG